VLFVADETKLRIYTAFSKQSQDQRQLVDDMEQTLPAGQQTIGMG